MEQKPSRARRDAAAPQARAVSAVLHLGEQSRGDRHLLLAVWADLQHEIGPDSWATTSKGGFHVESVATGNRDHWCDRQPGVHHGRAGADADISLEEGRTVPGAG